MAVNFNLWSLFLLIYFVIFNRVLSDNKFTSVPITVKSFENDTVLLPCYFHESEPAIKVLWYKDGSLLADSSEQRHLPDRIQFWSNYSLEVKNLQGPDTGDYTCEVVRAEPWGSIRQVHSIEVQYAPIVKTIPDDGFLEVKKGEYVDIGCDVTGTPTPIVDWKKNGEPMALLDHRTRIRFKAEHRLLAGLYECIVNNGVGDPVKASIRVLIQDAPVVTAPRSFVHTAIGLRATLAATLHFSTPPARTHWYKEGKPIKTDDRIVIMVQDNVHNLIFRSVRMSDFGNYTFRAENKLGMADVSFRLTGIPNVASFKVDPLLNKATSTSFTLIWEVDSYSTIIEYNLWLRPYIGKIEKEDGFTSETPTNYWSKIVVPGDANDGPIHSSTYMVRGLTPSTVYEALVTSRNRFGWSKSSSVLHFATEAAAYRSKSPTTDYSEVLTPTLEEPQSEEAINRSEIQVSEQILRSKGFSRQLTVAILILCQIYHFI